MTIAQDQPPQNNPASRIPPARGTALRALGVAGMFIVGIATLRILEVSMHATFDKPPAPLTKELALMKKELGSPIRYECKRSDLIMSEGEIGSLGTDKYLLREFIDKTKNVGEPGRLLDLNVNYYPTGSSTPHVPEICWKGKGREEVSGSREVFEVNHVRRADGSFVDLRMRLISFKPDSGDPSANQKGEPIYSNVAYVFQVNGDYVANPQEVVSQFWKASYKYAYHCKIEITPMDVNGGNQEVVLNCTPAEAKLIVSDFIRDALPAIEDCLPRREILTENQPVK